MSLTETESIVKFYEGAEVFITGGSGFIGKVVIEKLLRSCPRIKRIYVLMRPKKNKAMAQRVQTLTDSMLFDLLKEQDPDAIEKISVIEGNASHLNLGISDSDIEKIKNCSVIFHAAASVRFDDPLKSAILLNVRGTEELCKLACKMPNLKSMIHVSTAYIRPKQFYTEEKLYPFDGDWKEYVRWAEELDEDIINILSLKLTDFAPNTYTFTKHMAEQVCVDYRNEFNLPITIFRPSIVSLSEVEPIVGWCDSFNGPMGLSIVGALALSHVVIGRKNNRMDVIPVDLCVKGMITSSWTSWREYKKNPKESEMIVLNAASVRYLTYETLSMDGENVVWNDPSSKVFGIPDTTFTPCLQYAWLLRIFRNIIPSILVDTLIRITGGEPQLLKAQRTIYNAERALAHFTCNNFTFNNFKFLDVVLPIPPQERDDFDFDKPTLGIREVCTRGYKLNLKVLLGETDKSLEMAKKRYPYIYFFFKTIHMSFVLFVINMTFKLVCYSYDSFIEALKSDLN